MLVERENTVSIGNRAGHVGGFDRPRRIVCGDLLEEALQISHQPLDSSSFEQAGVVFEDEDYVIRFVDDKMAQVQLYRGVSNIHRLDVGHLVGEFL